MDDAVSLRLRSRSVEYGYTELGWSFTPLRGKRPTLPAWQACPREPLSQALAWCGAGNVGLRCGAASGGLVVIDLDVTKPVYDAAAVKALNMPATVTARTGSGGWHVYFRLPEGVTLGNSSGKLLPAVDVKAEAGQVVFPGSIHPDTGAAYTWYDGRAPWEIGLAMLPQDILDRLQGDKRPASSPDLFAAVPTAVPGAAADPAAASGSAVPAPTRTRGSASAEYARKALAGEIAALSAAPQGGRGERLNRSAFALGQLVGGGVLDRGEAVAGLLAACYANGLVDTDGRKDVEYHLSKSLDAGAREPRRPPPLASAPRPSDPAAPPPPDGPPRLGERHPTSGRLLLSRRRTRPTAEAYVREFHSWRPTEAMLPEAESRIPDAAPLRTLHHVDGRLVEWMNGKYVNVPPRAVRRNLLQWMHEAVEPQKDGGYLPFPAAPFTVEAAYETLCDYTHIAGDVPRWISGRDDLPVGDILPLRRGFLYLPTRSLYPATPDLLTYAASDVAYDAAAPEPAEWLTFLRAIWPADEESIQTLREWFGYCLTADMSQQKILLLLGPRRSGKGTILRILAELVGTGNVCYPTVTLLADRFGPTALLGKTLALMSEPRFSALEATAAMERLLTISGQDSITVDRKYNPVPAEVRLTTRIVVATNQVPSLPDASGAMAGRWLPVRMTRSWYGCEDLTLIDRLLAELPGILSWSIDGLASLRERGRFHVPTSARDVVELSHELSSPVMDWIDQRCELRPDATCAMKDLYSDYKTWCGDTGRSCPPINVWSRNLMAAAPTVSRYRKHSAQGDERHYTGIALRRTLPADWTGAT